MPRRKESGSSHKKVFVETFDGRTVPGYVTPTLLGRSESLELLNVNGEVELMELERVRTVYFVNDFEEKFLPERKSFLSRPKLDGLWVRLRFRDEDAMEGIVANNLLELLDTGVRLTPPDLHGNVLHMFVPRSALAEMKVLGVVGVARRTPRATRQIGAVIDAQSKLFGE